jgi:hypothetical protein
LAFSNIKISLEGKNGTGWGGEFVTQMGDFERCGVCGVVCKVWREGWQGGGR